MSDRQAGRRLILAIETSCDETAVAIVADGVDVLSNVVSSQIEIHAAFGGVVPEVASRAHLDKLESVTAEAMERAGVTPADLHGVAATCGPGLIGALLIGVSAAKAMAMAWGLPYIGVNHMEGHLFATFLENPDLELPLVVLLVSGGHTMIVEVTEPGRYRYLGSTIDDAAGEAFDKVARYLGLGYPGGPIIDRLAAEGDPTVVRFPRAMMDESFDFSFSGVKTAVVNYVRRHPEVSNADIAAAFQDAVVDVLVTKTIRAARHVGAKTVCLGGGVAANSQLRTRFAAEADRAGLAAHVPDRAFCTDNAAMIAAAADWRLTTDGPTGLDGGADPSLKLPVSR
ncbi:MAG: tRNA (adenosine(37)-N6)-threonylcarbamoyltransferase complex transferase subunit TsaD [Acidimicrobiales bacterium]